MARTAAKLAAVVFVAGAVGAGVGVGAGALTADDEPVSNSGGGGAHDATATRAARSTSPAISRVTPPASTTQTQPKRLGVRVLSSLLTPAGSASGKALRRARLVVRVRLTNRGTPPMTAETAELIVGSTMVRPDANASQAAGALLQPVVRANRASGELHFETAGDVTTALTQQRVAKLRFGGKDTTLRITVGPPAEPGR